MERNAYIEAKLSTIILGTAMVGVSTYLLIYYPGGAILSALGGIGLMELGIQDTNKARAQEKSVSEKVN
jgi:hypothetical protein